MQLQLQPCMYKSVSIINMNNLLMTYVHTKTTGIARDTNSSRAIDPALFFLLASATTGRLPKPLPPFPHLLQLGLAVYHPRKGLNPGDADGVPAQIQACEACFWDRGSASAISRPGREACEAYLRV